MTANDSHPDGLRDWARGSNPLMAATELLIRAGFAQEDRPWVHYDEFAKRPWIDFDAVPDLIGGMSGGEQRLMRIAASIGGTTPIMLGDEVAGLDRRLTELVSIALIHAAGFSVPMSDFASKDGVRQIVTVPPLAQWPETDH